TQVFLVLSGAGEPRLLLPVAPAQVMNAALKAYTPYSFRARLVTASLSGLFRTGWTSWVKNVPAITIHGKLEVGRLVQAVTGEQDVFFAFSIGTPGSYRKVTAQVMRPDGQILGYIKLPLT